MDAAGRTTSHVIEDQDSILLRDTTLSLPHSRFESTTSLLHHESEDLHRPVSRKLHLLRPTLWMFEVLSLFLAASILAALSIVLALYDHKPSPVVGGVTLNTVVAFASTLFRVCLMVPVTNCMSQLTWSLLEREHRPLADVIRLDQASRGPLGSLQLLWKHSYSTSIYVAAFLVILGTAIGPSFQQSVVFGNVVVQERVAYASAAKTYNGSLGHLGVGNNIPFNLKSAIYSSVYSSGLASPPNPPYSCPRGGNCTWSPYPTLGVSVQCFDVTSKFHLNCLIPVPAEWEGSNLTICALEEKNPSDPSQSTTSAYTVFHSRSVRPHNESLHTYDNERYRDLDIDYGISESTRATSSSLDTGSVVFEWQLAKNLELGSEEPRKPSVITSSSTFEAGICVFYLSMQVLCTQIDNGVYNESIIRTTTGSVSLESPTSMESSLVFQYTQKHDDPGQNQCPLEDRETAELNMNMKTKWNIEDELMWALPNATMNMTSANILGGDKDRTAESFYRSPNVTSTMSTIAHYMTVALRANDTILAQQQRTHDIISKPEDNVALTHRVEGSLKTYRLHVLVRWHWLAVPAGALLLTAGLLLNTVQSSWTRNIGVWKDNPLAILLNTEWRPAKASMAKGTTEELEALATRFEARVLQNIVTITAT